MSDRNYDSRYVYGQCTWHDSIHKAGHTKPMAMISNGREVKSHGLPCCPFCGSMLMELSHKKEWDKGVAAHDAKFPGYAAFVTWNQGKCFKNIDAAILAYNKETGLFVTRITFGFEK